MELISSRKIVPSSASSKRPILSCTAPVNAPFCGRKLRLEQILGQRRAVDRDERLMLAVAVEVQGAGDEFLAGAALTLE
jgi:hypothetical protein